jgi:hypothetical protein
VTDKRMNHAVFVDPYGRIYDPLEDRRKPEAQPGEDFKLHTEDGCQRDFCEQCGCCMSCYDCTPSQCACLRWMD